jgi:glycosyltransferase involved in cell wall biosynthesis
MKLLFVVSSLDLTQPFSATPAWWQLLKGLYEIGVEVIAAPYQGPPVETPWWRAESNPAQLLGDTFKAGRDLSRRLMPSVRADARPAEGESAADRLTRSAAQTLVAPLWQRHLDRILTREPDIDAVIFLTVPLNHLKGVAGAVTARHGKPVLYYDGDVPASLPSMQGFATGFRIYQGADLGEYAAFISNSAGGCQALLDMGARAAHALYYGADPDIFAPLDLPEDIDVFFYGHGREYRDQWIDAMLAGPARAMPDASFAVRGTHLGDLGPTRLLPYLSFSKLREYACRSRINLCITRGAHASVFASSSSRPFELAGMARCIVANPYDGLETWFEPGKEVFIVGSQEEAVERYTWLLAHESERLAVGRAARERVLKEHTFRHRAAQLREIVRSCL